MGKIEKTSSIEIEKIFEIEEVHEIIKTLEEIFDRVYKIILRIFCKIVEFFNYTLKGRIKNEK